MSIASSSSSSAASSSSDELVDDLSNSELESWREVHGLLIKAVLVAREAVAAKKAQRRFWLEEICANLNEQGKLTTNSVWKRPVPPKKAAPKRAAKTQPSDAPPSKKRRKKSPEPAAKLPKRARKKKAKDTKGDDDADRDQTTPPKKAKKIRLKLPKSSALSSQHQSTERTMSPMAEASSPTERDDHVPPQHYDNGNSDTEDEDDDEVDDDDEEEEEDEEGERGDYGYNPGRREEYDAEFRKLPRMGAEYGHTAMMGAAPHPYYLSYPGAQPPPMMSYYGHGAAGIQTGLHGQGVYSTHTSRRSGDGSEDSSSEEEY